MPERKCTSDTFHGVSHDWRHPRVSRLIPGDMSVTSDGFVTLYGPDQREQPDHVLTISNLGDTKAYENSADRNNPFVFTRGGYELTTNMNTGEYTYVIYPHYDVDFESIEQLNEAEQRNIFSSLRSMSPKIRVSNNLTTDMLLTYSVVIGQNEAELLSLSSRQTCPRNLTNVSVDYKEEQDRMKLMGVLYQSIKTKGPNGLIRSKVYALADLAYPKESVKMLFDDYAKHAHEYHPSRRDILSIASARVGLRQMDPFAQFEVE